MKFRQLQIEIIIEQKPDPSWEIWFAGLTASQLSEDSLKLTGVVPDHAALFGYLEIIRNLNLNLISLKVEEK
ncbi:MAG: hypothetical protein BGO78_06130 [Chloroflexi bacterium 44-23]|nr:MAG: hypothetical protein BGO78_06130 [Chloroflexi bacterium 44-23]